MAALFDNVPRKFFNPLAALSQGAQQQFYAECIITINSLFAQNAQVSREELKETIVDLLRADNIEELDESDMSTRSKITAEDRMQSPEERTASHVISYLADEEVGWIEEGIDSRTYSRMYMITEQGMMLADYVQRASSMKLDEMSNYLYNTFLALDDFSRHTKERENTNPYTLVIVNAYTNIRSLYSSLKMLRRSIKRIVQKVTGHLTFQQLMDNLGDYIDGDFIGEFTRLVDSENASLFRAPITTMLRKLMNTKRTREIFIRDCMKAGKEEHLTWGNAELRVNEQCAFIEDFLTEGYPEIVRDIRNQMVEYIMVVRLKLKMTMDIADGTQEVVGAFIKKLSEYPAGEETPQQLLEAFRILENNYISPGSVKSGAKRRGKLKNQKATQTVLSADEIAEEQAKMRRMQDIPYTKDKMKAFADQYKVDGVVRATNLPMATKDDVISDVAAAAFAQANGMDVTVEDNYIETPQVSLRDFTMKDKVRRDG